MESKKIQRTSESNEEEAASQLQRTDQQLQVGREGRDNIWVVGWEIKNTGCKIARRCTTQRI